MDKSRGKACPASMPGEGLFSRPASPQVPAVGRGFGGAVLCTIGSGRDSHLSEKDSTKLWCRRHLRCFPCDAEETEAQRGEVTCSGPHSK